MKKKILALVLVTIMTVSGCAYGEIQQEGSPAMYDTQPEHEHYEPEQQEVEQQEPEQERQEAEPTNEPKFENSPQLRTQPPLEDIISMAITDIDEIQNQVTVTIYNNSEYELMTGVHFTVEVSEGTHWNNVPWRDEYIAFVDLGYDIQPGDSIDFVKNLNLVIPLEQGQYRIRKSVFRVIDIPIRDGDLHDLAAEFYW
ncbi:MAG: hypothetical protein FWC13_06620 [Oscillospiraceae bacterium]|nr:hypothetical protein [Oscillospiraceae bacterium]